MKLTERQSDIRMGLREIVKTPTNDSWGTFTDFTMAIACMLDGAESLVDPEEMQKHFQAAWKYAAKLWRKENNRILQDCVGGKEQFKRLVNHPNGKDAIGRIQDRIRETCGEITPGMDVTHVEVGDILSELTEEETP